MKRALEKEIFRLSQMGIFASAGRILGTRGAMPGLLGAVHRLLAVSAKERE
jgi:hypothetical protein